MNDRYFATLTGEELGKELNKRVEDYYAYLRDTGLWAELKDSYNTYYGRSYIESMGENGELKKVQVNNYANLIKHLHVMVTGQRPAWEPRSTNTDYSSQSQTILAAGLLDFYMREKRLERILKKAAEFALFLREGWVTATWKATGGEVYGVDPETGRPLKEGDIEYRACHIMDVVRDITLKSSDGMKWVCVRDDVNRFDLSAEYPEFKDEIMQIDSDRDYFEELRFFRAPHEECSKDMINVWWFYHDRTESLPDGRAVQFLEDGSILFDGPLPYHRRPAYRISGQELEGTPFGHSSCFDLLPIQKASDAEFSTIVSNHNAFGVQNIAVAKGSGVTVTQVTGGLNLIEYDPKFGPPQPLNLVQTPPEIFKTVEMLNSVGETISGVNSIARGNAPASLSGAAMALIQSTALQFASSLQATYIALLEDVGTATIKLLQDFAVVPRVAAIVGKNNRSLLKEFKADDLSDISRVTVDSASALSKTTAGKVEIANQLLNSGMITDPEQYLMVLQTGQLEPMLESDTSQLLRIRSENERLVEGQSVVAMISDDHQLDVKEHLSILDSPDARENPEVVEAVLAHVNEHIELAKSMPPELMQLLGRQPLQSPGPQVSEVLDPQSPISQAAEDVRMPSMPNVAGTNEEFNPADPAMPQPANA